MFMPRLELPGVLDAFGSKRPASLRVNTLRTPVKPLVAGLRDMGIPLTPVAWSPTAFIAGDGMGQQLLRTAQYEQGLFYLQSMSSQVPPLILEPKPGEQVLDITAAPGGKTTQMAAMMNNAGSILANDIDDIRHDILAANLRIQGVHIVTVERRLAQTLWTGYPEQFDRALADVPCSLEGRFTLADRKSWAGWSMKKIHALARLQRQILRSAFSSVKPGGTVVYSTCAMSPEENEGVLDWFLRKEEGCAVTEPVVLRGLSTSPALKGWEETEYHPGVARAARIHPSRTMEGFFLAKIRKVRSNVAVRTDQLR